MRGGPLVVVGDSLLDVDLEGIAERLAPDVPVPVVDCQRERHRAGGAGLAAVLASGQPGPGVVLITALAGDSRGARLRTLLEQHVDVLPVPLRGSTPCKIRVAGSGQPLVRLDAGGGRACLGPLDDAVGRALRQAGAILVCDYGRGLTAHPGLRGLVTGRPAGPPVVWDPHPKGQPPVPGIRLATPSQAEARGFAAEVATRAGGPATRAGGPATRAGGPATRAGGPAMDPAATGGPLGQATQDAAALSRAWGAAVAVTLGAHGALLSTGDDTPFLAPAPAIPAAGPPDTCGAGDCFAASAARVLQSGGLLTEAVTEAASRAAQFVASGGASAAPGATIPPGRPERPRPGGRDAWAVAEHIRSCGGQIVATGGCFDLLHAGHIQLLRQARRLGAGLIVCLNSDASVRALKGPGRPLVPAADRARVLTALECVDAVLVFDEPTPSAVLRRLRPDVWVKGSDYTQAELAEAEVIRGYGGQIMLLPYTGHHSTSQIVAKAAATFASREAGGVGMPSGAARTIEGIPR